MRRRRSRTIVRHPAKTGSGSAELSLPVAAGNGHADGGLASVPHCPHLEEFERCDSLMLGCRMYSWHWTPWSPCLLPGSVPAGSGVAAPVPTAATSGGSSDLWVKVGCGAGRLLRFAECRRSDDEVVAEEFCRSLLPVGTYKTLKRFSVNKASPPPSPC